MGDELILLTCCCCCPQTHTGKEQVREKGKGRGRTQRTETTRLPQQQHDSNPHPSRGSFQMPQRPDTTNTKKNRDQTKPRRWREVLRRVKVSSGGGQDFTVRDSGWSECLQRRQKPSVGRSEGWDPREDELEEGKHLWTSARPPMGGTLAAVGLGADRETLAVYPASKR